MKACTFRVAALIVTTLAIALPSAWAAEIRGVPFTAQEAAQPGNSPQASKLVMVDNLVYPSGIYGTRPDALDQVDEVIDRMNARLAEQELSFGNMLKHTWFVKDGAVNPIAVLTRFSEVIKRVAPDLNDKLRSVGTIVCVPEMPGFWIEVDAVGTTEKPENIRSAPYASVPMDVHMTATVGDLTHVVDVVGQTYAGDMPYLDELDAQIDLAVRNMRDFLKAGNLDLGDLVSVRLVVLKGAGTAEHVQAKFHEAIERYAPGYKARPAAETLFYVEKLDRGLKFMVVPVAAK